MNYKQIKRNPYVRRWINRFKTVRDKIIKIKCSITFLIRCRNTGITPKFINNATKNITNLFGNNNINKIQNSIAKYTKDMQHYLLKLAIHQKHEMLKLSQGELRIIEFNLRRFLMDRDMRQFLDFEDNLTRNFENKVKQKHRRKFDSLKNLQRQELGIRLNKKWFVNKTNIDFPTDVQWALSLGHKHALPIKRKNFPTLKIITDSEDFIQTLENKEEQEIARTKLTTIIDNHLNKMKLDSRDKFILNAVEETERFLKKNRNIIILKADKGNTTVALNKNDYNIRIQNIVDDVSKYKLVNKDPTSRLQRINNDLVEELFKNKTINTNERLKLKTSISIAPRLYGLPKIHKDNFPLRPICSFVNSPSYELCKYISRILEIITIESKYNVKNTIQFKNKIKNINITETDRLISLDVVSLFPSVPVDLAITLIGKKWDIIRNHTKINKPLFLRILKFCIEENRYFQYNKNIYVQHEGLPMGSPASPIIADIVMEELLDSCIEKLIIKPKIMAKYVDDLFCIISENGVDEILDTMNSFCPHIKFTVEKEFDKKLPYLDTILIRKDTKLVVDWYQKPTSSGRIINYYSKHNKRVIMNTARNLIERVLSISDREFHSNNIKKIRKILIENDFPDHIINRLIRQVRNRDIFNNNFNNDSINNGNSNIGIDNDSDINNISNNRNVNNNNNDGNDSNNDNNDGNNNDDNSNNDSNKNNNNNDNLIRSYKSIIYIPNMSERLERTKILNVRKYKLAYRTYSTLGKLFSKTKDKVEKWEMSNLVYKIPCKGNDKVNCDKVYVGTTKNKLKTRIAGHKSDQRNRNINSQKTALSSHCHEFNHSPNFENASILNVENNYKKRLILEMLQIISVPKTQRINFKKDTDNIAQMYRHLINKK